MPSALETAVDTYVRAASERDPAAREKLLEACFAEDGRIVSRAREIRGRAALLSEFDRLFADPEFVRIRITSAIDVGRTTFRFHSAVDRRDGTTLEFFDAGEIDASGRIALVLTFAGPLEKSG